MKKTYIIALILSVVVGCSINNRPDYVIPQDDIVEIIAEMHMADGMMTIPSVRTEIMKDGSVNIYEHIFLKYGYTRADFDTSIYYYSLNINQYDEIYKEVLNKLTELDTRIRDEDKNEDQAVSDEFEEEDGQ